MKAAQFSDLSLKIKNLFDVMKKSVVIIMKHFHQYFNVFVNVVNNISLAESKRTQHSNARISFL